MALKNIDVSKAKSSEEIDKEFDQIISYVEARRKVLKTQLEDKSKTRRDNICSREDNVKNIISSLNQCLEEGQCVLTLNDFAALSQCKTLIENMKKLETEGVEYRQQTKLINSIPFFISSGTLLEMINALGTVGEPPAPSFAQEKCKANIISMNIEWKPIEYNPPITAYVLELGQNDNNFNEVYRGLETKYNVQGLKPGTSYTLCLCACSADGIGNTALLNMKTLDPDLNNWTLSMSSTYAPVKAENTRESLLDGLFVTGAAAYSSGKEWIQATFQYPVPVTSVTIATLHKNPTAWTPTNGNGGSLQYSYDNNNWTTVGTIAHANTQQQQNIKVNNVTAQYWRLFCDSSLGTSSFIFK